MATSVSPSPDNEALSNLITNNQMEQEVAVETAQEDLELLTTLGASIIDREQFEAEFITRLEKQYLQASNNDEKEEGEVIEDNSDDNSRSNDEPSEARSKMMKELGTNKVPKDTEKKSTKARPVSILQQALEKGRETEREKQVRTGEMTPFGNTIEKTSAVSTSMFVDFSKYLETQRELASQHKNRLKLMKKKQEKADESDEEETSVKRLKEKVKNKLSKRKNPLDMNILFPKKKAKKPKLGTRESDDPRDSRRTPGKLLSERTSMYLNESDDSEYVPSESEMSEAESGDEARRSKRNQSSRVGRKQAMLDLEDSDSEYDSDEDIPKTSKRAVKKEADDGNMNSYSKRIQRWKESETRLSEGFHKVDGSFILPEYLWESLYNYQKIGIKWLWELHNQRCGGILGDEMGLGKTIQVISFLAGLSCSNLLGRYSDFRGLGPTLIVCPATIMHQWVKEFHKWWPAFRVAILHESGSYSGTKKTLVQSIQNSRGILITTYAGVVNNQNEILRYKWHYVIVDEGHKIRNPDAQATLTLKQVATPHRLILSGSPLQNNLKELWSLFDFIYPGKLGTLPIFMEQFAVPITQGGYSNASEIQVAAAFKCATVLRNLINPYLLRRMKSDVNKHLNLPEKNEQVLFCKLTNDQRELYLNYINSKEINSIVKGDSNVFVGLINLRKICNHPHLFDGGPKVYVKTKHYEERKRLEKRIPKNKLEDSILLDDDEGSDIEINPNDTFGHWNKSGKMIVVKTLLKLWKDQGHKVLLFTQSRQMLCILENFVRQEQYSYLRLDGGTSIGSRQPLIAKFNEDPNIFVFLLTTRVGGLGVNLTGANRVILFDPDWNPSTDLQARERAWRIGQNRQVTIYRLITSGTIEEKIYHRQIFKQFLTNRVLKDPKQRRFFKSNDMMELFTYNEGTKGTESEAIFAGTGSKVKVPKMSRRNSKQPREKSSGRFRGVPNLVKQRPFKPAETDEPNEPTNSAATAELEKEKAETNQKQDEYVLHKLFKKSGVHAALKHDKIVGTNESDYLLIEKEAEKVAQEAISVLKKSRKQCWAAESGKVSWTGTHGELKPVSQQKPLFGAKNKSITPKKTLATDNEEAETSFSFFSKPKLPSSTISSTSQQSTSPITSADLIAMIRSRNAPLSKPTEGNDESDSSFIPNVKDENIELLREIREFIAFRAMIDGQASTDELLAEFGNKLPPQKSPLFKEMLNQLCTHRQVDGKRLWRLKPEYR